MRNLKIKRENLQIHKFIDLPFVIVHTKYVAKYIRLSQPFEKGNNVCYSFTSFLLKEKQKEKKREGRD